MKPKHERMARELRSHFDTLVRQLDFTEPDDEHPERLRTFIESMACLLSLGAEAGGIEKECVNIADRYNDITRHHLCLNCQRIARHNRDIDYCDLCEEDLTLFDTAIEDFNEGEEL
jgi:hypothetical protein